MRTTRSLFRLSAALALVLTAPAQSQPPEMPPSPILVGVEARRAGNPLAGYLELVAMEDRYNSIPGLDDFYRQVLLNHRQFMGDHQAALEAMALPMFASGSRRDEPLPPGYAPQPALKVISKRAAQTRIVIWAEEHHLPQTRSLYEPMLRELWELGYRYLAAEAFTDNLASSDKLYPGYDAGFYVMDPVFAGAVRVAMDLGYKLVAYDTSEQGDPGDHSFRDRRQAENIIARTFAIDPGARVLVLAGRGHASEQTASDGWTPMASVLKQRTGLDPFTVYAVTMGERSTPELEHPWYREATGAGLITVPTIFVSHTGAELGFASCDAYLFWPRTQLIDGRPDWLRRELDRLRVPIPERLLVGAGPRLIQVRRRGEPAEAVPVDQILLGDDRPIPALLVPPGNYWTRQLSADGEPIGPVELTAEP